MMPKWLGSAMKTSFLQKARQFNSLKSEAF